MKPFSPTAATVNIDVSTSSQEITLGNCDQFRLCNNGSATVWCQLGDVDVEAAVASGFPVTPGMVEVLTIPQSLQGEPVYVAVIAAGSTGRIYFTPGTGI